MSEDFFTDLSKPITFEALDSFEGSIDKAPVSGGLEAVEIEVSRAIWSSS